MNNWPIIILIFLFISSYNLSSQVTSSKGIVINEFMASNDRIIADQNGDFSDWIELFNQSGLEISLDGYYLSDNRNELTKCVIGDIILPPASYIVLWASGKDSMKQHLNFKLSKEFEEIYLTAPDGQTIIDKVSYGKQFTNMSLCKLAEDWYYSKKPTPGKKNDRDSSYSWISEKLHFIFNPTEKGVICEIQQTLPGEIIYTTDGTPPSKTNGNKYDAPFYLDSLMVVRAIQIGNKTITDGESSAAYLGELEHEIPVISLVTDPKNLWDQEIGIFVKGKHYNYSKRTDDWIRKGSIQYFENQKLLANYEVDFKIYGAGTRKLAKKSMSIIAREPMMDHFFESNDADFIDGFVLRASYSDYSRFRNETVNGVNTLMGKKTLTQETHPCVLYINGIYWGMYHLMERKNINFIENHYKTKVKDLLDANILEATVLKGSKKDYKLLLDTLAKMDMKKETTFKYLNGKIDLLSFSDFWIHELYTVKVDRHNNRFWKSKSDTAKWRYVIYDFDSALKQPKSQNMINHMSDTEPIGINIFGCLMQNSVFRSLFFQRLCDYLNFGYNYDNVAEIIQQFDDLTRKEFKRDYVRWSKEMDILVDRGDYQIKNILEFVVQRNHYLRSDFATYLGYTKPVKISNPNPEMGELWVNGYLVKSEAIYFSGMEIQITVKAKKDYNFIGWTDQRIEPTLNGSFKLDDFGEISPVFE